MKTQKNNISQNLSALRRLHKYSQEDVAEQIGVSRQTVAKWETGESIAPKGKHIFGAVRVGKRGLAVTVYLLY